MSTVHRILVKLYKALKPKGGATLQLMLTSKTNPWALTFFFKVKYTIFWLNIGLRVYINLYVQDFPKSTSKYFFFYPSTFQSRTLYFGGVFVNKNTQKKKFKWKI